MSENFPMEVCIYLVIKYNRKKETMFLLSLLFQLRAGSHETRSENSIFFFSFFDSLLCVEYIPQIVWLK